MMTKNADKKREQMMMFSMDDMVPQNYMLRLIDRAINWNFIYDLVEEKYCPDNGRPSMDPVMLIKIPFIQYLYGIKKHAPDYERDRGKRCIPLVSRTRHVRSSTSFFYIWKELYPPFQRYRPF